MTIELLNFEFNNSTLSGGDIESGLDFYDLYLLLKILQACYSSLHILLHCVSWFRLQTFKR